VERDAEQLGLFLVRHRRLDGLLPRRDHDAVVPLEQLVEGRVLERLARETRHDVRRDVQRLERHGLAVGKAQAPDQDDARIRGDVERASDRRARVRLAQLDRPAACHHAAAAHVLAEGRQRQLLGDLRFADERAAAVPPFEVPVSDEVVERGPEGKPRYAELAAEPPFGRDGLADLELVDQLEHTLPGQDLFAHVASYRSTVTRSWSRPLGRNDR
jgi:hypothetical protein